MARMILTGVWLALLDAVFLLPMWTHDPAAGDWLIRYTVRLALLFYAAAVLLMLWPRREEGAASGTSGIPNDPGILDSWSAASSRRTGSSEVQRLDATSNAPTISSVQGIQSGVEPPHSTKPAVLIPHRRPAVLPSLARDAWSLAWLAYLVHLVFAMKFAHHWSHADAVQHTQERSGFGAGIWFSHVFTLVWTLDVAWWWLSPGSYARRPAWIAWPLHAYMAFIIFCGTVVYETGFIRWAGLAMFIVFGCAFAWRMLGRQDDKGIVTRASEPAA